jgi:hypothetical protein
LAKVAGGRNGHTVLAPNSLTQFGSISSVLGEIWADKWLQLQYNNYIPENSSFASLYTVTSNTEDEMDNLSQHSSLIDYWTVELYYLANNLFHHEEMKQVRHILSRDESLNHSW